MIPSTPFDIRSIQAYTYRIPCACLHVQHMKRIPLVLYKQSISIAAIIAILFVVSATHWILIRPSTSTKTSIILPGLSNTSTAKPPPPPPLKQDPVVYRRSACSCTRPILNQQSNVLLIDEIRSSLCSQYSTLRGLQQRVIAISMYGPKENAMFTHNKSMYFLDGLINDTARVFPGWILRIYHDASVSHEIICPIECAYNHVDFCNASALGNLGSVSNFVPPKIWRFLPVGDELVDITASRDLDSPLTQRELDAVNSWLSTGKAWHSMRDHPWHNVPMLGGMWAFHSKLNRTFAKVLLGKILNQGLISRYGGRNDQTFLSEHVWPFIQDDVIAHDSFLCQTHYGKNSRPWPTRRRPFNGTDCFVGCVRPCCTPGKAPFGDCPVACRPKNHTHWTMC